MKNLLMSMLLSGANRIAGTARGHATAAFKREAAKNTRQVTSAWTQALFPTHTTARKKGRSGK